MSLAPPRTAPRVDLRPVQLALVVVAATVLVGGLTMREPFAVGLPVVAGAFLLGLVALAVARYDAAVAVGFVLIGFVRIEPAPADLVFTIVIAVALVTGRLNLRRVPFAPLALVGVLVALTVMSVSAAVDMPVALRYLAITAYLGVFFIWLIGYVDSRARARLIVIAYLVSAVISAILGMLPFVFGSPALDVFATEGGFRAQALFKDPNVYGPFLVPAALILIEELINPRLLRFPRWLKLAAFSLLVPGLLLAQSRAAWISFGIGFVALLGISLLRRTGTGSLRLALASAVGALLVLVPVVIITGATSVVEDRARLQTYDTERFQAQREGIQLGMTHPVGVGPGQFDLHAIIGAHSLYIRVFAEQGPLGLLALLLLLGLTFGVAAANVIAGRDTYGIGSAALFAIILGLLVNSLVVDTLHWRHLWIFAALIWVGWAHGSSGRGDPGRIPTAGRRAPT
jgi:O-antigen ligase